jgi:hypothetical protein
MAQSTHSSRDMKKRKQLRITSRGKGGKCLKRIVNRTSKAAPRLCTTVSQIQFRYAHDVRPKAEPTPV